ncbi:protein kinase [Ramlibacter sp. USB13]|uniref:Protein kinase n=1 Tax=Ramlibacter cellulosilyticus TaxID=2764187 RepID=A0A923MSX6_9BURK|nr:bifunctional serine/threonine-protein kinase/universal stress protein [Ramlibacter cellulosilyticus]MBC5784034.1 protein kinase [Ramlibacter cellulosilyticus]
MTRLQAGSVVDGFVVGPRVHAGAMAELYRVTYDGGRPDPGFPMVMKVPRMGGGEGAENLVGFEVEQQMLQVLEGPHVPRFVAAGDLARLPFLVMEYVEGRTLQSLLDEAAAARQRPAPEAIARWGRAVALAVHSLHQQNAVHQDLKPANVLLRADGRCVLIDFGLSWHAHYPDLLAAEMRPAIGSPAWMAPEQVVGVRGDPRSDLFAIGAMLYELATGELPFGEPVTQGGLRQRLWMDPAPPRALQPACPPWLQEVILHCLEPEAAQRPPSAAHLAFDLAHPEEVDVGTRGQRTTRTPWTQQLRRWIRAAGLQYQPSPQPSERVGEVPIVMAAVPHHETTDAGLYALRQAVKRSLGIRPGARLACVTVVAPGIQDDEAALHRHHGEQLRQWARGLDLHGHQVSFQVLQAEDVAGALLAYARANHVSLMVLGAATHGLALQRWIPTVPARIAAEAPCSVLLVRDAPPLALLGQPAPA